jgi:hypothetical protein
VIGWAWRRWRDSPKPTKKGKSKTEINFASASMTLEALSSRLSRQTCSTPLPTYRVSIRAQARNYTLASAFAASSTELLILFSESSNVMPICQLHGDEIEFSLFEFRFSQWPGTLWVHREIAGRREGWIEGMHRGWMPGPAGPSALYVPPKDLSLLALRSLDNCCRKPGHHHDPATSNPQRRRLRLSESNGFHAFP